MWLRVGKRGRWRSRNAGDQDAVSQAALDLKPRDNERLSVYQVHNTLQARRVAAAFAITQHYKPDHIEIILIPSQVLVTARLVPVLTPLSQLPAYLRDKHHEIPSLDSLDKREDVARRALRNKGLVVERITKQNIRSLAIQRRVLKEPGIESAVRPGWLAYLN